MSLVFACIELRGDANPALYQSLHLLTHERAWCRNTPDGGPPARLPRASYWTKAVDLVPRSFKRDRMAKTIRTSIKSKLRAEATFLVIQADNWAQSESVG